MENLTQKVELKHSLGIVLIKYIFGIYLVVTILLTMYQMKSGYEQTKKIFLKELVFTHHTFKDIFPLSLWQFDRTGYEGAFYLGENYPDMIKIRRG